MKFDGRSKEGKALKKVSVLQEKLLKIDGRSKKAKQIKTEITELKLFARGKSSKKSSTKSSVRQLKEIATDLTTTTTPKAKTKSKSGKFTSQEEDDAQRYFDRADSRVRSAIKKAYSDMPRKQWPLNTFVSVNNSMKTLNTEAVASVLGI